MVVLRLTTRGQSKINNDNDSGYIRGQIFYHPDCKDLQRVGEGSKVTLKQMT